METIEKTLILSPRKVLQKIERIAHQIAEQNFDETELIIIGIKNRGYEIASQLTSILDTIDIDFKVTLLSLTLNKRNVIDGEINLSEPLDTIANKSVILVDDVLNSGKTLIYAVKHILNADLKKLTTAVLVDRRHRKFPIKADLAGLTLSTTILEHISVEFDNGKTSVYLK